MSSKDLREIYADPEGFYSYRISALIAQSKDPVERFAYQFFKAVGFESVAVAIDPLSGFRFSAVKPTPANRLRVRTLPVGKARTEVRRSVSRSFRTPIQTATPYAWDLLPLQLNSSITTNSIVGRSAQDPLVCISNDTTKRTRAIGSDVGEFEKFDGKIRSNGSGWAIVTSELEVQETSPWDQTKINKTDTLTVRALQGPRARYTSSAWNAIRTSEKTRGEALIEQHKNKLVNMCMPTSRSMGLARSIAELRELPQTVKTSLEGLIATVGKGDFREQPINFLFGWKPLVADIKKLVELPEKLSRMVNYRLNRNGLPTTFRAKLKFIEQISNPTGFTYDALNQEINTSTSSEAHREVELRAMANVNVRFPMLEIPLFREVSRDRLRGLLYEDLQGGLPHLVDIYKLIPWSWLVDWFSGLGEYLDLIESINGDRNLFNYGFFTYVSKGVIRTTYHCGVSTHQRLTVDGVELIDTDKIVSLQHESRLEYQYQLRKSIAAFSGWRMTNQPESLNSYQATIIGALALAKSR